jgi:hypothetical protein
MAGIKRNRVIVPGPRQDWLMGIFGSDAPALDSPTHSSFSTSYNRRAQSGLFVGSVHCFWTILGNSRWFHRPGAGLREFSRAHSIQPKLLKVAGKRVHKTALVAIQLMESWRILSNLLVTLDNVIYGTVEDHKPRGIAGYNLGQDSRRGRYLLIPALIGYQSIQNLLPDALLVLGGNPFRSPLLNSRKAVLEGVHVAWRTAFAS